MRPMGRPLAFAFAIPLFTLARMMDSSSSAKTALIWMKVWLMGVNFAVAAVHRNETHNHQPKPLLLDGFHDFAKLLGAARQTADLQGEDGIALIRRIQEHMEVLLHLRVPVFIVEDHFFRARGFQFADLPLNVLLFLAGGAAGIAINHRQFLSVNKRSFGISLTVFRRWRGVFGLF